MTKFSFKLLKTNGKARIGLINTPHGIIDTPIFMPVGTCGSVKALGPDDLIASKTQIILGNTYHLMLRPGENLLKKIGGLHKFMQWSKPILTDSGGFQVFSLNSKNCKYKKRKTTKLSEITKDGVKFKSFIDGSSHIMTPEKSITIQNNIGSDFLMPLDHCLKSESSREDIKAAMHRTTEWLDLCIKAQTNKNSKLFGIIQGGIYSYLREQHAKEICQRNLFGFAIGGLSVGEKKKNMWLACEASIKYMPKNKPRYLMGVGTPKDLLNGIALGIDMFDCVMPTRNARNGCLFTSSGKILIKQAKYKLNEKPLDEKCQCYTCRTFSCSYLRHLFKTKELLFYRLSSLHNITYYLNLVKSARIAIKNGNFYSLMNSIKE